MSTDDGYSPDLEWDLRQDKSSASRDHGYPGDLERYRRSDDPYRRSFNAYSASPVVRDADHARFALTPEWSELDHARFALTHGRCDLDHERSNLIDDPRPHPYDVDRWSFDRRKVDLDL